ncbi:hypothetical protein [Methylobacterium sp. J-076]|uniref:hypothetical protein n=1 Tax=Methylobacterium sp. J-076 TaxID=2836655 RepID=UPI001FBBB932|nr:hypothetical protein [Methylobacterium sp. J-076]MCJ2012047.1 hypothetical protein [Methylobacterium sp. J-076]
MSDDVATPASLVRGFLSSLMKAALISKDAQGMQWRDEATRLQRLIVERSGELGNLKIDGLWWLAVNDAETPELEASEGQIQWGQPKTCPFTISELSSKEFNISYAVQHLRETASTG